MWVRRRNYLRLIPGRLGQTLVIEDAPSRLRSKPAQRKLLGAILWQAMNDGMLWVQRGCDLATGEPHMRYYGPAEDPSPRWWDMVAPPASLYGRLLQAVFALSDVDESLPVAGRMQAKFGHARVDIRVEFHAVEAFELSWTPADCLLARVSGSDP